MNMEEVNEIRSQIGQLRARMMDAQSRLEDAGLRAIGLKHGDRIEAKCGRWNGFVMVTGCMASYGTPRPTGVKIKADGTPGQASAGYIKAWEKIDAE